MNQFMPPFDRDADAAGFTLLEILVAITLLGLVIALVHGGVRFGTAAWDTSHDLLQAHDDVVVARDLLERLVGSTSPGVQESSNHDLAAFAGDQREIEFIASSPIQSLPAGQYRVTISEQRRDNTVDLVLSLQLLDSAPVGPGSTLEAYSRVLLEGATAIEFSYLPVDADRNAEAWTYDWRDTGTLPGLVRIDIRFAPTDRRSWYPLIVEPMADMPVACAVGPATQACP